MKNTYIYEITEREKFVEDIGKIKSYGIMICNSDKNLAKQKK